MGMGIGMGMGMGEFFPPLGSDTWGKRRKESNSYF